MHANPTLVFFPFLETMVERPLLREFPGLNQAFAFQVTLLLITPCVMSHVCLRRMLHSEVVLFEIMPAAIITLQIEK